MIYFLRVRHIEMSWALN